MITWLKSWFRKAPKRQKRYVLNLQRNMPDEYLLQLLRLHTPVISAREFNKLPEHLRAMFVPCRKG